MSGAKCLLDTNVVIGLLKQHAAAIKLTEAHQLDPGQVAISQMVIRNGNKGSGSIF